MSYTINAKELKKLMIENGFDTILSLAEETGVNRTTLGKILSGEQKPSSDAMYRIAAALKISGEQAGKIFFAGDFPTA